MLANPASRRTSAGRRIVVVHDPKDLPAHGRGAEVALHGHDHHTARRFQDGALVFNPGECAGHLAGHNRVGVVDLRSLETELLYF